MGRFDIRGSTALVTGGNTGIGRETAVGLARLGARVVFTSRDAERGRAALLDVRRRSGRDDVELMALDLASLASVRAFAAAFRERFDRLHVLVNNAGVAGLRGRQETEDGFERMFGVNHLGHFLLTRLLLDRILASAPARIVNLSSEGYRYAAEGLPWDDLQSTRDYQGSLCYGRSKLANLYFTRELARRLSGTGVAVHAVHPGYVATELGRMRPEDVEHARRSGPGKPTERSAPDLSHLPPPKSPEEGAKTSIFVASSPEVEGATGEYWVDCQIAPLRSFARDDAAARRLWEASEKLVASAG
jgi:NAD(P)-dependent dehydrogenase (short-subunit alcohol dehydrogenase family)